MVRCYLGIVLHCIILLENRIKLHTPQSAAACVVFFFFFDISVAVGANTSNEFWKDFDQNCVFLPVIYFDISTLRKSKYIVPTLLRNVLFWLLSNLALASCMKQLRCVRSKCNEMWDFLMSVISSCI